MKHLATTLAPLLLAAFLFAHPAVGQHTTVSVAGTGGIPQGDFGDHLDRVALGLNAAAFYGFGPISLGLEGGFVGYDRNAFPLPTQIDGSSAALGSVETSSRIGHLHAVVRLQYPEGPLQPYVDGLFGFQRFSSTTQFDQTVLLVSDGFALPPGGLAVEHVQRVRSIDAKDHALSYGVGGGVLVRVARGLDDGRPFEAFLDLGARYVFGEQASYQFVGTDPETNEMIVEEARSLTDMLRPQIGLVVRFGG